MEILDAIQSGIEQIQTVLIAIAATFAVISVLCLGLMYMGSSIPFISEWKTNNPKAFNHVTIGLILTIIASGTGISSLIGQ